MVTSADGGSISSLLSGHWVRPKVGLGPLQLVSRALTADEDALMNRKVLKLGRQWTLIARMLDIGTTNEVNNRWKMLDRAALNRMFGRTHREPRMKRPLVMNGTLTTSRYDPLSKFSVELNDPLQFYFTERKVWPSKSFDLIVFCRTAVPIHED
jgi:hypothetical protein